MNISNRIASMAHSAVAAIRRAFACCFPCCCRVSNTEEVPETNVSMENIERRPSQTGSTGSASSVVSQLGAYNDVFLAERDDDTQSRGQSSAPSTPPPTYIPPPPDYSPTSDIVEAPIVREHVVPLGTGDTGNGANSDRSSLSSVSSQSSNGSQSGNEADDSDTGEVNTNPQHQAAAGSPPPDTSTGEAAKGPVDAPSSSKTPSPPPSPAPRTFLGKAATPTPPMETKASSPEPSTSKSAEPAPPKPQEDRLFSVRSIPKSKPTREGTDGLSLQAQQTLFAVTTSRKIIRKRNDPASAPQKPKPLGAVAKAKAELGVEPEHHPAPPKPPRSTGIQERAAIFEPKPEERKEPKDDKSKTHKKAT